MPTIDGFVALLNAHGAERNYDAQTIRLLPAVGEPTWQLTINDGSRMGPVAVFDMRGWSSEHETLVG